MLANTGSAHVGDQGIVPKLLPFAKHYIGVAGFDFLRDIGHVPGARNCPFFTLIGFPVPRQQQEDRSGDIEMLEFGDINNRCRWHTLAGIVHVRVLEDRSFRQSRRTLTPRLNPPRALDALVRFAVERGLIDDTYVEGLPISANVPDISCAC